MQAKKKVFFILPRILARLSLLAALAALAYGLPRILISHLGEDSPWTGYLYSYGLGAVIFALSLWRLLSLAPSAHKTPESARQARLYRRQERRWAIALSLGLAWGMILHGLWIFLSISIPFKG